MAPYDFEAPDADTILRCSDGKELRVHRVVLGLASPIFQSMFGLPQSAESPPTPIIDISESSEIIEPFIQFLYPRSPPKVSTLAMWEDLCVVADKYNVESVMELLRDMLIPKFLKTSPIHVYALASRWGFGEEAKIASGETVTMDISKGVPEKEAELMGGIACQKLHLLHSSRREKAQSVIRSRPYPTPNTYCACSPIEFKDTVGTAVRHVSSTPWLTTEAFYQEVARASNLVVCSTKCRNHFKQVHAWISSVVEAMSELPQTI